VSVGIVGEALEGSGEVTSKCGGEAGTLTRPGLQCAAGVDEGEVAAAFVHEDDPDPGPVVDDAGAGFGDAGVVLVDEPKVEIAGCRVGAHVRGPFRGRGWSQAGARAAHAWALMRAGSSVVSSRTARARAALLLSRTGA